MSKYRYKGIELVDEPFADHIPVKVRSYSKELGEVIEETKYINPGVGDVRHEYYLKVNGEVYARKECENVSNPRYWELTPQERKDHPEVKEFILKKKWAKPDGASFYNEYTYKEEDFT